MLSKSGNTTVSPEILLEIIRAQTEIAQQGLDLGGVMAYVADHVQKLTGANSAIVELAEDEEMVYRAASGTAASQLGLRLLRSGSLSGLCVAERRILRCDDSESDPRVNREACRRVGLRSMVVAPLNHHKTTVGVLKIAAPDPAAFTDEHVHILELVCDLIASAMYRAAQFETSELYHKATHDALTGLVNRALFYDRLRQSLHLAERQASTLGVLMIDMDGLKPINDNYGHRAGDAAITETGRRIREISRKSDTVARLGGDEFAVMMTEIDCPTSAARQAEKLGAEIARPFVFENHAIALDASIGVATFPSDGGDVEALIERADQAMYAVKRGRRTART